MTKKNTPTRRRKTKISARKRPDTKLKQIQCGAKKRIATACRQGRGVRLSPQETRALYPYYAGPR